MPEPEFKPKQFATVAAKQDLEMELKRLGFIPIGLDVWLHHDTSIEVQLPNDSQPNEAMIGYGPAKSDKVHQFRSIPELHDLVRRLASKSKRQGR